MRDFASKSRAMTASRRSRPGRTEKSSSGRKLDGNTSRPCRLMTKRFMAHGVPTATAAQRTVRRLPRRRVPWRPHMPLWERVRFAAADLGPARGRRRACSRRPAGAQPPTFWTASAYIAISAATPAPVTACTTPRLSTIRRGVDHRAPELVVVGQRGALLGAAVDHEEPAEVAAVRIEQRDVEPLDPPVGAHPPEHLDELAEDRDSALLAAAHRRSEPYEQRMVSH